MFTFTKKLLEEYIPRYPSLAIYTSSYSKEAKIIETHCSQTAIFTLATFPQIPQFWAIYAITNKCSWILMFCKWQTPLHTTTHFYTTYRLPPPQTMLRGNGTAKRYPNFNYILNFTSRPQNQLHCCTVILNL